MQLRLSLARFWKSCWQLVLCGVKRTKLRLTWIDAANLLLFLVIT